MRLVVDFVAWLLWHVHATFWRVVHNCVARPIEGLWFLTTFSLLPVPGPISWFTEWTWYAAYLPKGGVAPEDLERFRQAAKDAGYLE